MKKIIFLIIFVYCFSNNNNNNEILNIIPNNKITIKNIKLNKEILLKSYLKNLKENQCYKIMVHFIGSFGISFEMNIICDDIYYIKKINKENINLNDFNEYDFKTNKNKIPNVCNEFKYDFILISLVPKSITYQLITKEKINFSAIVELIENKINTNNKIINILFNKGLIKGLFFVCLITLIFLIFQNKIKFFILKILQYEIHIH
jgi:hypothetical protein